MTFTKSTLHLKHVVVIVMALMHLTTSAQDRCATVELLVKKRGTSAVRETDEQFEQWMNQRSALRRGRAQRSSAYVIPVVFHVIHKGEAVGTGVNIPDAQLISQIAVLNRDFNRNNNDASSTPAEFASVAGHMNINFVLARQDPGGNPTSGIVRVRGSKNQWSTSDESTLKALSYWPAEDYLNIWITDLSSTLLGYAQFPVSNLAGLEDAEDNRLTDGVVVDYSVVGSNEDGTFNLTTNFNKGRSATHEVGHYFGLRHIWGDDNGSCSGSGDYVDDTPNQGNSTDGCPSHPQISCTLHSMFQNYMDYTNDACMNLFTAGQVERMITVMENSPRRASLLLSSGADDPAPSPNDVALISVSSPSSLLCEPTVKPVIRILNKGTLAISKLSIAFSAGNESVVSDIVLQRALPTGDSADVLLNAFEFQAGNIAFNASVVTVNNVPDVKQSDNTLAGVTYLYYEGSIPYRENFDGTPGDWHLLDSTPEWQATTANGSKALFTNAYTATKSDPAVAITPRFVIDKGPAYMIFDVAYSALSSTDVTALAVYALKPCSDNVEGATLLYKKSGVDLATTSSSSSRFVPSATTWRQEVVDLSPVIGWDQVRFAIVTTTSEGNDLYLDNFQVVNDVHEDVVLSDITEFSPVSCDTLNSARLTVLNRGASTLDHLEVSYKVNGELIDVAAFESLGVSPGAATTLNITDIPTALHENTLVFELVRPNGLFDTHDDDNAFQVTTAVNTDSDIIPYRETFDSDVGTWTSISPYGGSKWIINTTNSGGSMVLRPGSEEDIRSSWLASPSLDFTNATEASLFFDYSRLPASVKGLMESRADSSDTLNIMVSTDCGVSYSRHATFPLPFNSEGIVTPESATQWTREYVNLSQYAGQAAVRIAFVLDHPDASVFVDNVEFFLSADSTPVAVVQPFEVYGTDPSVPGDFYITFHLEERQNVSYSLLDMTGRSLSTNMLTDVLNQTFQVKPEVSAGIYLLRVQIGAKAYTNRVYIDQ
ncbi:MAG: M43 family zinc metalloprotease [Chryseolinea sp.]